MDTKQYIDILDLSLGKTLEAYDLDIKDIIFQPGQRPQTYRQDDSQVICREGLHRPEMARAVSGP